ncbi:MAG: fasciclin domain-containing protein [Microcoleaceae cyanobacterium]
MTLKQVLNQSGKLASIVGITVISSLTVATTQVQSSSMPNSVMSSSLDQQVALEITQLPTDLLPAGAGDIVGVVLADGRFKILATALKASGLLDTLKKDGPFTLFAPTDEAFNALPDGALEKLLQPENQDQLAKLLQYHVVPGKVSSGDLASGEVKTAAGKLANVNVGSEAVTIGGAKVIDTDIAASNGIIHVIDKVMILPE